MKYVALLRGINISGKNKIAMSKLKTEFEMLGYKNVITYLNSGNIIFESDVIIKSDIVKSIYDMIKNKFNLDIPVYLLGINKLKELLDNKPNWWGTDNREIYDNIIFIIEPFTYEEVRNVLGSPNEDLEKIQEYKNNIFWSYSLKDYRKTNWWSKTASTSVSSKITIRTANTVKKLFELCNK